MNVQEKIEQVYTMIAQSQETGITIDQIASNLKQDILTSYYVSQLILARRIQSSARSVLGPLYLVASTPKESVPARNT